MTLSLYSLNEEMGFYDRSYEAMYFTTNTWASSSEMLFVSSTLKLGSFLLKVQTTIYRLIFISSRECHPSVSPCAKSNSSYRCGTVEMGILDH